MGKIHATPEIQNKAKHSDIGRFDVYKLENVNFDVTFNTVIGSKETIPASPVDRVLIVVNGFANTIGTNKEIRDGAVVEIPANETFEYQGQLKYFLVGTK